ncbi:MAG: uroporphyrinogen decarboxylase [Chloroflexi bacterium]|uniref:Uroporphyrinogen decarboxylase n=1 Tax=Candidatus Chlorohelix allophototropha TaxID=3003348 RepID=A0A8T7M7M3_9CHLR|nr:uroporphyrinogen decarboxylase [Chloroflexota bacterium]WJW68085.1 uroporphyrinogen decarboxylase [Chloroflexota bacterium L227-S17]
MLNETRFIRACRRETTDATPVWFMRQAGRYMQEYRAIREKVSMLESLRSAELACEITLQPINAFDLDAAIIFADILTPLIGMGINLDFVKGEGPQIDNPVRTTRDIDRLATPPTEETMPFVLNAIRMVTAELNPRNIPLIGFIGAPFTLASYAIEGAGSRNYEFTKALMYSEPAAWKRLMDRIVTVLSDFMVKQVEAGASALQIFDSWAGALSPRDYAKYAAPYNKQLIEVAKKTGVPVIYFSTGTASLLEEIRGMGSDVIGVDWRIRLDKAWEEIGYDKAIMGNLDPVMLKAPWEELQANTDLILQQAAGRPGHIFNLGHGILQGTSVDMVKRLADYVHQQTAKVEVAL